jgi:hypothetical protein
VGGRIIVQQKKISREERSWTNPLNALQEVIHYSFIKFCIYCVYPLVRILCALRLESLEDFAATEFNQILSRCESSPTLQGPTPSPFSGKTKTDEYRPYCAV